MGLILVRPEAQSRPRCQQFDQEANSSKMTRMQKIFALRSWSGFQFYQFFGFLSALKASSLLTTLLLVALWQFLVTSPPTLLSRHIGFLETGTDQVCLLATWQLVVVSLPPWLLALRALPPSRLAHLTQGRSLVTKLWICLCSHCLQEGRNEYLQCRGELRYDAPNLVEQVKLLNFWSAQQLQIASISDQCNWGELKVLLNLTHALHESHTMQTIHATNIETLTHCSSSSKRKVIT